jgi:predicted nucleic acid-binding protein
LDSAVDHAGFTRVHVRHRCGAVSRAIVHLCDFGGSLFQDLAIGSLIAKPVAASDCLRIAELVAQYKDLSLGTVDASVIASAERLGTKDIAILDRRHFAVVQLNIGARNLLP